MSQSNEMAPVSMGMQRKIVITPEQIVLVKKTIFPNSTDDELKLFFYECERCGVHPLDRMIFPIKRKIGDTGEERVVFQASIDYLRSASDDAGDYMGMDEPVYEGMIKAPDGKEFPECAKVTVYKLIHREKVPFTGVARWKEFYPGEKLGFMWRGKPYHMLGKCAEAQARRLAWPKKFNKLYIPEELQQMEAGDAGVSTGQSTVKPRTVTPEVVDDSKETPKEDAIQTLKREIGEYCGDDEAKMKEMLKKATLFKKDNKEVFASDFSKLSLPWAGKALGAFRKLIKPAEAPEGCTSNPMTCDFSSFVDSKAMCGNNPCKPGEGQTF